MGLRARSKSARAATPGTSGWRAKPRSTGWPGSTPHKANCEHFPAQTAPASVRRARIKHAYRNDTSARSWPWLWGTGSGQDDGTYGLGNVLAGRREAQTSRTSPLLSCFTQGHFRGYSGHFREVPAPQTPGRKPPKPLVSGAFGWWLDADSNRRPRDYETLALTT